MKKRKKTFLLLELLIGISLLAIFAIPLLANPAHLFQNQIAALEKIELERISEVEFAKLKKKIYLQEIPWETLTESGTTIKEDIIISLPGISKHRFEKTTIFRSTGAKEFPDKKEEYHLIEIKTSYMPKPRFKHASNPILFIYRILVKQAEKKV